MARLLSINARQRQLLQRIVDGHEPVTRSDSSLVITVNALSDRGLVTKVPQGNGWIAVATEAGRAALVAEQGQLPVRSVARRRAIGRTRTPGPDPRASEAGRVVTELVEPPTPWPSILKSTVNAVQAKDHQDGQLQVQGRDMVFVSVPRELRQRALAILWALTEELRRENLEWRRVDPGSSYLPDRLHSTARGVGSLALVLGGEPFHPEIREVSWWRGENVGRLAVYLENRSWPERDRSNGQHFFNAREAAQQISQLMHVTVERQQVAHQTAARQAEEEERLEAQYRRERAEELEMAALASENAQRRRQIHDEALSWETADRLRRYAAAIDVAHPDDKRWQAWKALIEWEAYMKDPLLNDAPDLSIEPDEAEMERVAQWWPEKRPFHWTPAEKPAKPRRGRRPATGG